jgi:hypothetical protein
MYPTEVSRGDALQFFILECLAYLCNVLQLVKPVPLKPCCQLLRLSTTIDLRHPDEALRTVVGLKYGRVMELPPYLAVISSR